MTFRSILQWEQIDLRNSGLILDSIQRSVSLKGIAVVRQGALLACGSEWLTAHEFPESYQQEAIISSKDFWYFAEIRVLSKNLYSNHLLLRFLPPAN